MEQEKTRGGSRRSPSSGAKSKASGRASEDRQPRSGSDKGEGLPSRMISIAAGRKDERGEATPDAVEMLKNDHEKVRSLFKKYEAAAERSNERKEIVDQISAELAIHAELEEKVFYQAFREVTEKDPQKVVRESFEEHKIVKTLLKELGPMRPRDPQFEAKVTVLRENVEHHVEEEEDELLPAAQKLFGEERLMELGAEMMDLKEELQAGNGMEQ
ncbi:MAG: hemerythrin domain-containing protein [Acidobacteriota bacterium]